MWIELKICCEKQTTCTTLLFVSNKQIGVFIFVQHQHRFVSKTENPKKSNKKSKSRNTQQKFQNENPASDSIFKKTAAAEHIGNVIFFFEISGKKNDHIKRQFLAYFKWIICLLETLPLKNYIKIKCNWKWFQSVCVFRFKK